MATTLTSIHKANDANGFTVSFQLDHVIGATHAQLLVMHESPGRVRNVEIDVPLTEFPELIKSLQLILEETPTGNSSDAWCSHCGGSGQISMGLSAISITGFPCPECDGKGMRRA